MAQSFAGRLFRPGLLAFVFALAVAQVFTASLLAAPCSPSATTLCLNAGRFQVEVQWKDSHGRTGPGQAVPITADTGDFWFFSPANIELVVKVLDARGVNGNYWVFYGALSNVEYDLVVTDTATNRVKTYSNPQGQFASVGDTKAFAGDAPAGARLSSRMDVEGFTPEPEALADLEASTQLPVHEADATPVPCDGMPTDLGLNGCRFLLSVAWKDSHGRTGAGQPVPLTNDTGYFWFFSPANIELVIKVLDARGVNGNFWVFYGALSNVEYTLTVADTLTGAIHTYTNPSGQFASEGDTKAFHPGYSVAAHSDATRAVSQDIPVEGGTVSATAADGTVFTLTVPDGALLNKEKITLTPVASVDRLPLSGGLAAAVQLAPEGLLFFEPATLVIAPATPVASNEEVTFGWRGAGEEFGLHAPDPTGSPAVSLSVSHCSTYGVGRGSSADLDAQRGRPLSNRIDQLEQDLQAAASAQRKALRDAGPHGLTAATARPAGETFEETLQRFYDEELVPSRPKACEDDVEDYLVAVASFLKQVLLYTGTPPNANLIGAAKFEYEKVFTLLATCYGDAYSHCRSDIDASRAADLARIYEILRAHNEENRVDHAKIPLCLTFELTFDSFVEEIKIPNAGQTWAFRHRLKASVPGISYSPNGRAVSLAVPLDYVTADYTGTLSDPRCTMTTSGEDSVFTFVDMFLDLNVFEGGAPPPNWLVVLIEPGHPNFTFSLNCPGAPPIRITQPRWRSIIDALFGRPNGDLLSIEFWKRGSSSRIFALADDVRDATSGLVQTEITHAELKHTPQ